MCNPNSSVANHRKRATALLSPQLRAAVVKSSSAITKNLFLNHAKVPDEATVDYGTSFTKVSAKIDEALGSLSSNQANPTAFSMPKRDAFGYPTISKPKSKRRRKPQKPGKTAKMNDRHFVIHNYHDHAHDEDVKSSDEPVRRRGGVSISFPQKLHSVLDQVETDGLSHVISWQPHGRSFVIHEPKEFADYVMPRYFRQTKLTSFQRQLNLYGFNRLTRGIDSGGYYHELFLRGKAFLCKRMVRTKVKGTKFKAASSPDQEPDFYKMPSVVTPSSSDCDYSDDGNRSHGSAQPRMEVDYGPWPVHQTERDQQFLKPTSVCHQQMMRAPQAPESSTESSIVPLRCQQSSFPLPLATPPRLYTETVHRQATGGPLPEIFDEAVDELFLNDMIQQEAGDDTVFDFVNIWDPSTPDSALENDTQLGNMLERLLED